MTRALISNQVFSAQSAGSYPGEPALELALEPFMPRACSPGLFVMPAAISVSTRPVRAQPARQGLHPGAAARQRVRTCHSPSARSGRPRHRREYPTPGTLGVGARPGVVIFESCIELAVWFGMVDEGLLATWPGVAFIGRCRAQPSPLPSSCLLDASGPFMAMYPGGSRGGRDGRPQHRRDSEMARL